MIDIDSLKRSLNGMGKKNKYIKDEYIFKPNAKDGEIQIRILPYKYAPDNPFIQIPMHYNIGTTMRAIENDPITQLAAKLRSMYSQDREYWVQGKKLEPKIRIYAPILIRGRENEGVKFWGFGPSIYEKIVSFILDPDYGDITDLNSGTDIKLTMKQVDGKKFADTDIRLCRMSSPATTDPNVQRLIDNMMNIDDVLIIPTYEELSEQFKSYANGEISTPYPGQSPVTQSIAHHIIHQSTQQQPVQQPTQQQPVQQPTQQQPAQQPTQQQPVQQPTQPQPVQQSTQPQQQTMAEKAKSVADTIDDSFWDSLK